MDYGYRDWRDIAAGSPHLWELIYHKEMINYEKKQFEEHKETNLILWINTIATVLSGGVLLWQLLK